MDATWRTIIWLQFGAAIDMLDNAMHSCPDELWSTRLWNDSSLPPEFSEFWYIVYHTLFWLDLYLSGSVDGFTPPTPFTLDELDPAGVLPEKQYSKDELHTYLRHCRQKCQAIIETLTDKKARQKCEFSWGTLSFAELLLDNMRHVQEHAAQLNMILGQKITYNSGWVAKAKSTPGSECITMAEHQFSIRKASLDDVEAISTLTDAAYAKYIPLIGRKPQPMTADYSKMVVENSIWLLIVENQLVGVLVLVYEPENILIYSVAINPEYQKQGLGRHLLVWAEQQAVQDGYKSIRLYTNERFEDNILLYKHLGYHETSREPFLNSTLVHMAKQL